MVGRGIGGLRDIGAEIVFAKPSILSLLFGTKKSISEGCDSIRPGAGNCIRVAEGGCSYRQPHAANYMEGVLSIARDKGGKERGDIQDSYDTKSDHDLLMRQKLSIP